jgi:hypothetical protein
LEPPRVRPLRDEGAIASIVTIKYKSHTPTDHLESIMQRIRNHLP